MKLKWDFIEHWVYILYKYRTLIRILFLLNPSLVYFYSYQQLEHNIIRVIIMWKGKLKVYHNTNSCFIRLILNCAKNFKWDNFNQKVTAYWRHSKLPIFVIRNILLIFSARILRTCIHSYSYVGRYIYFSFIKNNKKFVQIFLSKKKSIIEKYVAMLIRNWLAT